MTEQTTPKPPTDPPAPGNLRPSFYDSIASTLQQARTRAHRAVNFAMVEAYWKIGRLIVEQEQQGRERAAYGERLIRELSRRLTADFGKGFNPTNLSFFKRLYLAFPGHQPLCEESEAPDRLPIFYAVSKKSPDPPQTTDNTQLEMRPTLRAELTWTHYRILLRVEDPQARDWYMKEAAEQNWSTRALERQINSLYYERLLMSRDRAPVEAEARAHTADLPPNPADFIKSPYVLEFLGIPDRHSYREQELEQAIIDKLQSFLLELGKGFAFVARQYRVSTETKDFFIDLVFYNYLLKCFVLIELKTGELTHEHIGQMDMYVRLFEDRVKNADDNPTVGIILCTARDHTIVKYSVLNESRQLFASKYQLYLPSEEELRRELERERAEAVEEQFATYGGD